MQARLESLNPRLESFHPRRCEPQVRLALELVKAAHAVVATSEPRLYGNMIMRKGVIYPEAS